jgi:hypothetical protein
MLHGKGKLAIESSTSGDRTFYAIKSDSGMEVNYTYANGYLIVAQSRALLQQSLSNRDAGNTLVRSSRFMSSLPQDGNTNFSAILYHDLAPLMQSLGDKLKNVGGEEARKLGAIDPNAPPTLVYAYAQGDRKLNLIRTPTDASHASVGLVVRWIYSARVSIISGMQGYQCSTCGEFHPGLPFSYGSTAPVPYYDIPEAEREERVLLSSDQCVIDDEHFFIMGRLEIPVHDADDGVFSWNVWVSLSKENFERASDLWETSGRENQPPYFGWLSTSLPCYEVDTFLLKTNIHTRKVGERPFVELEPTDHPLAIEQRTGIDLKRVQEIAECVLHT